MLDRESKRNPLVESGKILCQLFKLPLQGTLLFQIVISFDDLDQLKNLRDSIFSFSKLFSNLLSILEFEKILLFKTLVVDIY